MELVEIVATLAVGTLILLDLVITAMLYKLWKSLYDEGLDVPELPGMLGEVEDVPVELMKTTDGYVGEESEDDDDSQ